MNRRQFIKTTALGTPLLVSRRSDAMLIETMLYIVAGFVVVSTGVYLGYKIYKCYKLHFPDPAPAPVPTQGTNAPPTMPPKTNAPPVIRPKSMSATLDGGDNIAAYDVSDYGLVLPDYSPVIYYTKFDLQSSVDDMATWQHETTLEAWATKNRAVIRHDKGVEWCPDSQNVWLDLSSGQTKKEWRMMQPTSQPSPAAPNP